jgi:DNA topoisomerase IA
MAKLTLTFTYNTASGMFSAEAEDGQKFVVSPMHIRGNLEHMLELLRQDAKAEAGTWEPPKRTTPPPVPYAESEVVKYMPGSRAIVALEDLDLDLEI